MCGIVGQFNINSSEVVQKEIIDKMRDSLIHRGPDDRGSFISSNIGLGHQRLSIIDLSETGHQPMFSDDKSLIIVYNGEIYNFQLQRKNLEKRGYKFKSASDTEVILKLYQEYGTECLAHLRGMFAFAIWDMRKQQLFIARDRVGKKPILYSHNNSKFIFASEMQALVVNKSVSKKLDYSSIDKYLTLQYIPSPYTIFQDIKKLPPAHFILIDKNGIKLEKYWDINFNNKLNLTDDEWSERIISKLRESVGLRMVSDVPLGAFLSGGVDSSLIVALMSQISQKPINTFSIGFSSEKFNELPEARLIAKLYGTNHREFIVEPKAIDVLPQLVKHYGEPYADSSALPSYYLARETRKHVTVALNGDGGDENFLGYPWYFANKVANIYDKVPAFMRHHAISPMAKMLFNKRTTFNRRLAIFLDTHDLAAEERYPNYITSSFFTQNEKEQLYTDNFRKNVSERNSDKSIIEFYRSALASNQLDRASYTDFHTYLPDDLLVKIDIATMMNSLEGRSPFLDHEFIELTSQIPSSKKLPFHKGKYILRKAASTILPNEILRKKKAGFMVPLSDWFKNELYDYSRDVLLDHKSLGRGFFNHCYIEELIKENKSGKIDHGSRIWALLFFELWFKEYIDKS